MPDSSTPNLERIKERLWALRWLAGAGANLPGDQVCVRGQDRRTLAWLVGTDLPDLIAEVERLRQPTKQAEEVDAPADTRCWILVRPDGARAAGDWCSTAHFPTQDRALERAANIPAQGPWHPTQLDHPCVTITCGGCSDTFDGDSTIHFEDLQEAHIALSESVDWNRWTILPEGGYLCPTCNPTERAAVVEAVASNA